MCVCHCVSERQSIEETDFPGMDIMICDHSDPENPGALIAASAPHGNGCCRCQEAVRRGAVYMDWDRACEICAESPTFKDQLKHFSTLVDDEAVMARLTGRDSVHKCGAITDKLFA